MFPLPATVNAMKLIRYRVTSDHVEENEQLIAAVFAELEAEAPEDMRYLVIRLPDGTFVHLAEGQITSLEAHKTFRGGIDERCSEPPRSMPAQIVGNYRMLREEVPVDP